MLGLRDDVIEFEINPDRAYALSLRGVAREAALERYGLGRFQARWDELLADLGSRPGQSRDARQEEQILVPARERTTP